MNGNDMKMSLTKEEALDWLQEFLLSSYIESSRKLDPLFGGSVESSYYEQITIRACWHLPVGCSGSSLESSFTSTNLFKLIELMYQEHFRRKKQIQRYKDEIEQKSLKA